MIVSFLNLKGGTGKTTLATNVAAAAAADGVDVLLVDADKQGSARDWHAAGGGAGTLLTIADTAAALPAIKRQAATYGLVVIDGPPSASALALEILKISDLVLVPIQPSPADIWASAQFVELLRERQAMADGWPRAALIVSRAIARTALAADAATALAEFDLPILAAGTRQRVAYPSAFAAGKCVLDVGDAAAKAELLELWGEIKTAIEGAKR